MRAVVCHELGPPSLLVVEERPDPEARPGFVVIDVEAAGVNYVDALFVGGQYQIKPPLPFVPGNEVAGRVAVVGEGVGDFAVGQRVLANTGMGGYAAKVAVPAASVLAIPDRLSAAQAATLTQSFSTCLYALRDRAHLAPAERVVVLGGGGGIGLAAIGVARALGARVLAVASNEEKRAAAAGAGAEEVIDPDAAPVKDAVRAWAGGTGADVVVDPVGGALAEPALRALGDGGRYLVIGFAAGPIPQFPLNQVLLRNRCVLGIDWGIWAMQHPDAQRRLLEDLLAMIDAGSIEPVSPTPYPLEHVGRALDDLLERRAVGKLALLP
jgi:NADPH2:quinone reductase